MPPRNLSQTGYMWPRIAPAAAASAVGGPNNHHAKTIASVAFSASSASVAAASPLRPVRRTLVAPMLPEPIERKSPAPASFVSTSPKGMDPSK